MKVSNTKKTQSKEVFIVKDCALISISTGISAQTLREFRTGLLNVDEGSIYHHFWGRLIHPRFDEPEYNNDFASWGFHGLHDKTLAERLSVVTPVEFNTIDELRHQLVDICEERLEEADVFCAPADRLFHFLTSKIIVFETPLKANNPKELHKVVTKMSASSIYYHFIDARRRNEEKIDDFSNWLSSYGDKYSHVVRDLTAIDPYFSTVEVISKKVLSSLYNSMLMEADDE